MGCVLNSISIFSSINLILQIKEEELNHLHVHSLMKEIQNFSICCLHAQSWLGTSLIKNSFTVKFIITFINLSKLVITVALPKWVMKARKKLPAISTNRYCQFQMSGTRLVYGDGLDDLKECFTGTFGLGRSGGLVQHWIVSKE